MIEGDAMCTHLLRATSQNSPTGLETLALGDLFLRTRPDVDFHGWQIHCVLVNTCVQNQALPGRQPLQQQAPRPRGPMGPSCSVGTSQIPSCALNRFHAALEGRISCEPRVYMGPRKLYFKQVASGLTVFNMSSWSHMI